MTTTTDGTATAPATAAAAPDDAVKNLIRTALADLQPRITIAQTNIAQHTASLADARAELAALQSQEASYRAALGDDAEGDAEVTG